MSIKARSLRAGLMLGAVAIAAVIAAAGVRAYAAEQGPSPAEQQIKYRKALYVVMAGNFRQAYAMANGKLPYDAAALVRRAERVAFIAAILPEAFPPGSGSGAPTRAKPEIWSGRADFDDRMQELSDKVAALVVAAKSGDLKQIQPAVDAVGLACKNCHDKYRTEE
jgi:cytochrome c556